MKGETPQSPAKEEAAPTSVSAGEDFGSHGLELRSISPSVHNDAQPRSHSFADSSTAQVAQLAKETESLRDELAVAKDKQTKALAEAEALRKELGEAKELQKKVEAEVEQLQERREEILARRRQAAAKRGQGEAKARLPPSGCEFMWCHGGDVSFGDSAVGRCGSIEQARSLGSRNSATGWMLPLFMVLLQGQHAVSDLCGGDPCPAAARVSGQARSSVLASRRRIAVPWGTGSRCGHSWTLDGNPEAGSCETRQAAAKRGQGEAKARLPPSGCEFNVESLQRPNLQPVKTSPRPPARRQSMPSRRLRGVRNVRGVDPAKYHIADLGDDTLCDASTCVNSGPVGCDKYWHELDVKLQRPAVQYRPVLMLPATATV
eukprot:s694_g11.t3